MKAVIAIAALAFTAWAHAQAFPSNLVKIVVGYPPGGATDIVTRAVAQRVSALWGQTIIIENKPGANTNVAAADVAKAPADGYTLLSTAEATFAVNPYVYARLPFDTDRKINPGPPAQRFMKPPEREHMVLHRGRGVLLQGRMRWDGVERKGKRDLRDGTPTERAT